MRVVFLPLFFRMKKNCRFFAAFYQKNYKTAMSLFEKGHPAYEENTSRFLKLKYGVNETRQGIFLCNRP